MGDADPGASVDDHSLVRAEIRQSLELCGGVDVVGEAADGAQAQALAGPSP